MISKEKTAYTNFYSSYSDKELDSLFKITNQELHFVQSFSPKKKAQFIMMVLLKTHQYLGYFPQLENIPIEIINFIKKAHLLSSTIKMDYTSRYLGMIKLQIQQYLDVKPFSKNAEKELTLFVKECAYNMADPTDLVNASIAELLRNHYSLPSFEVLERLVRSARHQTHQDIYQHVFLKLSQNDKEQLNQLLIVPENHFTTPFGRIKAYPNTVKFSNINEWKERLVWLNSLVDTIYLVKDIPFTKIKQFATQANVLETSDMLDIASDGKRFTLLISLIHLKKMETKDDLVLMFIRRMKSIHNQAKRKLDLIQKEHQKEEENMFKMSSQIAQQDLNEKDDADFGKAIRQILANYGGSEYITNSYEMSSKYHDQNHHSLLWKIHVPYRKLLWEIIDLLEIQSSTKQNDLLASLKLFEEFKNSRKRVIEDTCFPLSFTSQKWKNSIIKTNTYDRQLLELCLLSHLAEDLQTTDLFITNSLKYADYRSYLLPMEECLEELNSYCEKVEIPAEPTSFIQQLQNQLHQKSEKLAEHFKGNELVEKPKLSKKEKKKEQSIEVIDFQKRVAELIPSYNLLDVLNRVNHWTKYTDHFYPVMGSHGKSSQALSNYLFTVFAYGTNIGPTQLEKHTEHPVTRRMLQRVNYQHIDSPKLQAALVDVVNQFNSFDLIHYWGDVSTMVADGTLITLIKRL